MKNAIEQKLAELHISKDSHFLLAVSGGVDSMVMMELFRLAGLHFSVAHCNFGLRGEDSNKDEKLVREITEKFGIPCFVNYMNLDSYKEEEGVSTQMAARDLRYRWFDELLVKHKLHFVVTAHHLDDSVETVLLNMARGTGIEGMTGMKSLTGNRLRPLIEFPKKELREFAKQQKIVFREDVSNSSNSYKRNKVRNKIVPLFQELNPNFTQTMKSNLNHWNEMAEVYFEHIQQMIDSVFTQSNTGGKLFITSVKEWRSKELMLYELAKKYGFERAQTNQLARVIEGENGVGKEFYSHSHRMLVDREFVFIEKIKFENNKEWLIEKSKKSVTFDSILSFNHQSREETTLLPDSHLAFLDADKLVYPLLLRKWKEGDSFSPLGMKGKKKVSDYLIDKKRTRIEKERIYVLLSDNKICWIVGERMDNFFKLTSKTKSVLKITIEQQ